MERKDCCPGPIHPVQHGCVVQELNQVVVGSIILILTGRRKPAAEFFNSATGLSCCRFSAATTPSYAGESKKN